MIIDNLLSIEKNDLPAAAKALKKANLKRLVELLSEKEDKIRYQAFLLLQCRSQFSDDVYPFWDVFRAKLKSDNSYQRSIGVMMIAENARWDKENRISDCIDEYLNILKDEKPITVRQCIQSLEKIVPYKPELCAKIANALMALKLEEMKETMRKLILTDIINTLLILRKYCKADEMEGFILSALSGEILNRKAKKHIVDQMK